VKLLLASNNPKKLAELRPFLERVEVEVVTPAEIGGLPEVAEDRPTFRENAARKAVSAAQASGLWALADDSGLEVDHLRGEPGVRSARWAGTQGDDAANNRLLAEKMKGVPLHKRGARFVCALALARPDGTLAAEISASALGRILNTPRGHRDFGYDPYFLFSEEGFPQTGLGFAEMTPEDKMRVSHRGRALRELAKRLPQLLREV
jgi:XTP/dITP diphosphohydrolase